MFFEILIIVYLLYFMLKTYLKNKSMPPGPLPLPFLGNLHQIGFDPPVTMDNIWMTYGDVYRITLPLGNLVIVNSAQLAREALVTKKNEFAGRPTSIMYPADVIFQNKDIVTVDFGEEFVSRKKMLGTALRCFSARNSDRAVREILELVGATQGKPFSLKSYVYSAVIGYLWEGISSEKLQFGEPVLNSLVHLTENISWLTSQGNRYQLVPFLRHFPSYYAQLLKEVIETRDAIFRPMITSHQHSNKSSQVKDITDTFLAAYESRGTSHEGIVTDIMHYTLNLLFGASTTTVAIVTWFALHVALDSGLQSKLQTELDHAVNREGLPRLEDIDKLPLLQATICEVIRYSPFMPFLIPHKTTCDTSLKGYHLPKDTLVLFNLHRINRDPSQWAEPSLFRPGRFLNANGKFVGWSKVPAFIPFGLGARSCPGRALGKHQVILIVAGLLRQFTINVAEDAPSLSESTPGAIRYPKEHKLVAKSRSTIAIINNHKEDIRI